MRLADDANSSQLTAALISSKITLRGVINKTSHTFAKCFMGQVISLKSMFSFTMKMLLIVADKLKPRLVIIFGHTRMRTY